MTAIRFYLVGVVLFVIPQTRDLFLWVTPWVLLANFLVILIFHPQWNMKSVLAFIAVIVLSILVEMKGVSDERIFGSYNYLTTLGIKFKDTPLLIGLNWFMLVYGSHAVASKWIGNRLLKILAAGLLMVFYDVIIEFVAPTFRMWEFSRPYPPLQNFIMWFILAFVFVGIFELLRINTRNSQARVIFLVQTAFFGITCIYTLLFLI